jgi:hypothetical protein
VEHVEAGLVRGEPGAVLLHAAERPHRDVPSGSRLHGQPQCSSRSSSRGASRRTPRRRPGRTASRRRRSCRRRARRGCRRRDRAGRAPSAETVWLRIGIDLGHHRHAEARIGLATAMAARRPAPPAPTMTTSIRPRS